MPQNLLGLPENADFSILEWNVIIRDHKVVTGYGLFSDVCRIIQRGRSGKNALYQFEKEGISYEATIEYCIGELENDVIVLADIIERHYSEVRIKDDKGFGKVWKFIVDFSSNGMGRIIACQLVEKIRSCENWNELCDELHMTSQFQKDMKNKIQKEVKQCHKV